jgi:1-acyl-sn-glycerol-3-phosphate acyltransferase
MLKNLLGALFALWAMLVFVPTMLIAYPLIWATRFWPEPKASIYFQRITRIWMRVFFFLSFVRVTIRGREYFERGHSYIVVCNHSSFMDIPLTTPFIPGPNRTIAKKEMASIPIFGMIYKRGSVLVDRKSEESRKQSFVLMKQVLDRGLHMCIYPEGTRNKTREPLQYFHNGAFKLAMDTGHPVMPTVILNTAKVLPPGKKFFWWPAHVKMHFLEPIEVGSYSLEELKDETFDRMKAHLVENR